jgi:hypothetical protein
MRTRLFGAAGTAIIATLVFVGSAAAVPGSKTVAQTYPVATALCAKASAGTLGKKLEPHQALVLMACTTLEDPFPTLVMTVTAAETQYTNTIGDQQALVTAACVTNPTVAEHRACRAARKQRKLVDASARFARSAAVQSYYTSVRSDRSTFWTTINSLRTPVSAS